MFSDHKIFKKFKNILNSTFIEVGAHNGITQSNTILLENINDWTGILIEPSKILENDLKSNRPNSIIEMCAVSNFNGVISGDFNGQLMSSIEGKRWKEYYLLNGIEQPSISVSCHTLTDICKKHNLLNINFCSIDVEGNEYNVLEGIDFDTININYFLIEIYEFDRDNIINFMKNKGYEGENFSNFSKTTHPNWDGTHQDYLFTKDNLLCQ